MFCKQGVGRVSRMFSLKWFRKAAMEVVEEDQPSPGMRDLPESCIASILRLTTPRDVARLACVSRIFRDASYSDSVWQTMLPPFYEDILAQAPHAPASSCSKKEIYDFLSTPVLLENGTKDFWLDRATGGVCRSIAARGLSINWGDDPRFWTYIECKGSRFAEVAYMIQIGWLEAQGNFQCALPSGTYTLSWRLKGNFEGFNREPVTFSVEGPDHVPVSTKILVSNERLYGKNPLLWTRARKWIELDVGQFTVERGDSPVEITFSMKEVDGIWKSGMFVDCVGIRPTAVRAKEKLSSGVSKKSRRWGRRAR